MRSRKKIIDLDKFRANADLDLQAEQLENLRIRALPVFCKLQHSETFRQRGRVWTERSEALLQMLSVVGIGFLATDGTDPPSVDATVLQDLLRAIGTSLDVKIQQPECRNSHSMPKFGTSAARSFARTGGDNAADGGMPGGERGVVGDGVADENRPDGNPAVVGVIGLRGADLRVENLLLALCRLARPSVGQHAQAQACLTFNQQCMLASPAAHHTSSASMTPSATETDDAKIRSTVPWIPHILAAIMDEEPAGRAQLQQNSTCDAGDVRVGNMTRRAAAGLLLWWLGSAAAGRSQIARPWPYGLGSVCATTLLPSGIDYSRPSTPVGWERERLMWLGWLHKKPPFSLLPEELLRTIAVQIRPLFPPAGWLRASAQLELCFDLDLALRSGPELPRWRDMVSSIGGQSNTY